MDHVASIQMASGPNIHANLIEAGRLMEKAAAAGARLIVLPENFAHMGMQEIDKLQVAEEDGQGPIQEFLAQFAKKLGVWIVGGSIPMKCDDARKIRAACLVYDENGQRKARYDKIHLFDVQIVETGEEYNESLTIQPGSEITLVDSPFGKLGLAVCYDLRFPEMFRQMLDAGMEVCVLPAAFTAITGKAHWEILVRARAIENLSYLVASAQGGYHINSRETYGHSMIVDPWGQILDQLPHGSGYVIAPIDLTFLQVTRRNFPCIDHARFLNKQPLK